MSPSPLRFVPYDDAADVPNVVVDGSPNSGTVLTISHWPAVPSPPGCAADSSTQMVFRYLDRGADLHGPATAVTNNHFDQDGLAGIHALVRPDDARRRRAQLEDLASAGDFAVFAERSAARLSMAVAALADPERTPLRSLPDDHAARCGVLYEAALSLLPDWLDDHERCRPLWEEEDAELEAGLAAVSSGAVVIEERPDLDLAVVTLPAAGRSSGHRFTHESFSGVHPMALHRATDRSVLLVIDPGGRHHLTCRYEGWVQFRSRLIRPRVDLRPLADRLGAAEPAGARWTADPPGALAPTLRTEPPGPPSSLPPDRVVAAVTRHLAGSPTAWDPFGRRAA